MRATGARSLRTSKPGFLVMIGIITTWWSMVSITVGFSGEVDLSICAAIWPPAPGLFSTTVDTFSVCASAAA